jgi:hypothetical protein
MSLFRFIKKGKFILLGKIHKTSEGKFIRSV